MRKIKCVHSPCCIKMVTYNDQYSKRKTMISQCFHKTNFIKTIVQIIFKKKGNSIIPFD